MDVFNYTKKLQFVTTLSKHEQIVYSILDAIQAGNLNQELLLPSVNKAVKELWLARETIVKAYNELKERDIVDGIPAS